MKKTIYILAIVIFCFTMSFINSSNTETTGGWVKYKGNPVLGGDLGTIFDISVLKNNDNDYRMYSSWRPKKSIALSESKDVLKWTKPIICLKFNESSSWEKDLNRPVVIHKGDTYHMWYTGQAKVNGIGQSWVGHATSSNGKDWKRMNSKPVLSPDVPWEKVAVMCPHVIWDDHENIFKMWYSGGDQYEPDAIGYETSKDGINWHKYSKNLIFSSNKANKWEQAKVTACQVIKRPNDYLMLYKGFMNIDYAQIGMARSKDGISGWGRYKNNPIIKPGMGWDSSAVYKPYAILDKNRWLLYYNGRRNGHKQIGIAIHEGKDLGF